MFETSNKLNKIWLKRLNLCIYIIDGLNWFEFPKNTNFNSH